MSTSSRKRGQVGSVNAKSNKAQQSKQKKASVPQQEDSQEAHTQAESDKESVTHLGLLQAICRLFTIFIKGFAALVLFALIFNLVLVVLNKTVFSGKLTQYIPAKNWRDILGH